MKRNRTLNDKDENENIQSQSSGTTIEYVSPNNSEDEDSAGNGNKRGKTHWQFVKPQSRNSLYYELLVSGDIEQKAIFWVDSYEIDPKEATIKLIQFIVDLCGYQNFKVEDYMNKKNGYIIVPTELEKTKNVELEERGKYLIGMRNQKCQSFINNIGVFIFHIVIESHHRQNLFNDENWLMYFANIVKDLCTSKKRSIRHTAVFIGLKLVTGLINVYGELHDVILENKDKKGEEELKQYFKELRKIMRILYMKSFKNNWNFYDKALYNMRLDCIKEVSEWFTFFPNFTFPTAETFAILPEGLKDGNKHVRMVTLQVLQKIIDSQICQKHSHMRGYFKEFIVAIFKRSKDKDHIIASFAIDILTKIESKHATLPENICEKTLELIYCRDFVRAEAAGMFLLSKLKAMCETDTELFLKIIRFQIRMEKKSQHSNMEVRSPLLLDSLFNLTSIFTNINIYIELLSSNILSHREKELLGDYLGETLLILTTGTPTYKRNQMRKRNVDKERNNPILKSILKNIRMLQNLGLNKFKYIVEFLQEFKKENPAVVLEIAKEFV